MPARPVIGILSALLLYVTATHLSPAIRAGLRHGAHGYWVATAKLCARPPCTWTGRFQSSNGHVLISSAQYAGRLPAGVHAGTHVAGLYAGGSLVYPPTGSDEWASLVVLLVLAAIGLYWSSHRLVRNYLQGRARATP